MGAWEAPEFVWEGTNSTDYATASNWSINAVPGNGSKIKFSETAVNHLFLDQTRTLGTVNFNNSNKKFVLGDFDLMVNSISGSDVDNHVRTNGIGLLKTNIENTQSVEFPVGNASYNPVRITNNTGSVNLHCNQTQINVTASGGVTYQWSNGLGTNPTVNLTSAGTYTLTAT
jgi:hypothetical protein